MIKRTVYIASGGSLKIKDEQLKYNVKEEEKEHSWSVEDLGTVILDTPAVVLTQPVLNNLLENRTSVIVCDKRHMPSGLFLPLDGNVIQNERFAKQIKVSDALKNNLWKQTMYAKIKNQALHLKSIAEKSQKLNELARKVKSGDPENLEARAARYYWKKLFSAFFEFKREYDGDAPNQLLNYGYAILRSVVSRALVISGLLPTLGIHHQNRYNAFALADDVMEPYRPFVDNVVYQIIKNGEDFYELNKSIKKQLIGISSVVITINKKRRPLMNAVQETTSSIAKIYSGELKKIVYPEFEYVVQQVS